MPATTMMANTNIGSVKLRDSRYCTAAPPPSSPPWPAPAPRPRSRTPPPPRQNATARHGPDWRCARRSKKPWQRYGRGPPQSAAASNWSVVGWASFRDDHVGLGQDQGQWQVMRFGRKGASAPTRPGPRWSRQVRGQPAVKVAAAVAEPKARAREAPRRAPAPRQVPARRPRSGDAAFVLCRARHPSAGSPCGARP